VTGQYRDRARRPQSVPLFGEGDDVSSRVQSDGDRPHRPHACPHRSTFGGDPTASPTQTPGVSACHPSIERTYSEV
jgi:hypothetical protein